MSRLGSFLVQEGILSPSDRQMIQRESSVSHGSFARSVLALGLLDEDELSALFASKTVFRQVSKDILQEMDYGVISIAPTHILAWLEVMPLAVREGALTIAMVDPTDQDAINQMAFFTGLRIKPVIATLSEILRGLREIGATFEVGESRFETFLKTHGRMSATNQVKRPAATKRTQEVEEDFEAPEMVLEEDFGTPDMTFEDDHFEATPVATKPRASADVFMGSRAPVVAAPMAAAQQKMKMAEPASAGSDLSDPGLAASAPDEPVSAASMELDMDFPPELETVKSSSSAVDKPAPQAANPGAASPSGGGENLDLSGFEVDLDSDVDDSATEAERPNASTPAAVAAAVTAAPVDDMDVDLSVDLSGGLGELPGALDDEIKIQPETDAVDDQNADLLAGMDNHDSGPPLEGASDELTLGGDDLGLGDSDSDTGTDAPVDLALADLSADTGSNLDELDSTGGESFAEKVDGDPGLVDLSSGGGIEEPGFDASLSAGAGEPDLDLGLVSDDVSFDVSPSIGDLGDLTEPTAPADVPSPAAPAASATVRESSELSGAAHAGIAVLNRALIQVQMAADAGKALARVADVAGKVGIDSGSVVTLKGGKLIPGIIWHKSGGKLGHIPDVPAGLDAALVQSFAAKSGSGDGWVSMEEALGSSAAVIKKAWPDAAQAPNMAFVRKQGDVIILGLASFMGPSDHDGLRQSFGDVIRAAGPKLGA